MFGEISTGASDDLEKASRIARDMLTVYGMSKRLPNLSLASNVQGGFLGQGRRGAALGRDRAEDRREQLEILRNLRRGETPARRSATSTRRRSRSLRRWRRRSSITRTWSTPRLDVRCPDHPAIVATPAA